MDRQPVLEGERLVLRPLRPDDWDALLAVASDRELWARHPFHDRWQEPVFREFFADALAKGGALAVIDKAQIEALRDEHGIYMAGSGRINVAGLTTDNIGKFTAALAAVAAETV